MTTQNFRTVLRGYEPAQVDAEIATLQQALDAARAELGELSVRAKEAAQERTAVEGRLVEAQKRADEASRVQQAASRPTFEELGQRVGQMLALAEEEADDIRRSAQDEAAVLLEDAARRAQAMVAEADRYAVDTRSSAEADAEARLTGAQRRADEILDHADREAATRREEAEAVYEVQQARAAQAAADFEKTLAERRDAAAGDFAVAMGQREDQLRAAEENLSAAETEAKRIVSDATSQAEAVRAKAEREAEELVGEAQARAERIRRDSDRELAAVTQRRDSITSQLSNVRQMLATLGGGAAVAVLADPVVDPAEEQAAELPQEDGTD
ncbi:DivIVA domain-containing protein [Tessaracoccus sp. Z1128]